ncbi:MAG: hypothetical protein HC831_02210 [Chloroflexia bacterium]|nr:hypothetical protein [Chloroflexia bacterium]
MGIQIKAIDENSISIIFELPVATEKANKQKLIVNMFQTQFLNISDEYFKVTSFDWNVQSEIGFYRIAEVNQFRRTVLELLLNERVKQYQPEQNQFNVSNIPFYKKELDYAFNVSNSLSVKFYARHGANVLEKAPEVTENYLNKNLMTTRYCIKYELGICEKKQLKVPAPDNSKLLIENKFGKYQLAFDCQLCRMYV